MLRALTLERSQIKDAMGFALDNADAAGEVMLINAELSNILFIVRISEENIKRIVFEVKTERKKTPSCLLHIYIYISHVVCS